MKLIKQPNQWSCLPTSLAMLLDVPLEIVLQKIGHDGSEIWFPKHVDPLCRRCFSIQEIIDVGIYYGIALVPISACCGVSPKVGQPPREIPGSLERFEKYLSQYSGILIGEGKHLRHAWAWNHKKQAAYDPNYKLDFINDITVEQIWIAMNLHY